MLRLPTLTACQASSSKFVGLGRVRWTVSQAQPASIGLVPITVQGKGIKITTDDEQYVMQRIQNAVKNYEHGVSKVTVRLSSRGAGLNSQTGPPEHRAEVTVTTRGHGIVRTEDGDRSRHASVDLVAHKLERKLRRMIQRDQKRAKRAAQIGQGGLVQGAMQFSVQSFDEEELDVGYTVPTELASIDIDAQKAVASQVIDQSLSQLPTEPFQAEEDHPEHYVSKLQYAQVQTMSLQEAVDEKFRLGAPVFVYKDADSNRLHVLYSQEDTSLGLVVPVEEGA